MNKELAKTLTLALVNYIDKNRPEGTMDCSSGECVSLEKAFTEENFDSVETLVNKKLSRLTEFEQALSNYLKNDFEYFHTQKWDEQKWNDVIRTQSKELIALTREQLIKDGYIIEKKEFYDAAKEVPPEVMKEVSDNVDKMEEELTKFEEKLVSFALQCGGQWDTANEEAKKWSREFLDLAMKDFEKTFECNPNKLPKWLKDKIESLKLKAFIRGCNKGYKEAEKQYNESVTYHFPIMPTTPVFGCDGIHCTNPQMDCINCPRKTTGGSFSTSSGTATATLHGNTSATDGKEHNPSFTD